MLELSTTRAPLLYLGTRNARSRDATVRLVHMKRTQTDMSVSEGTFRQRACLLALLLFQQCCNWTSATWMLASVACNI